MKHKKEKTNKHFDGVLIQPNLDSFIEARKIFGSQAKASKGLGYFGQTVISYIETGRTELDSRNYSLMLLLGKKHPNYDLKAKPEAKSFDDFIVKVIDKPKSKLTDRQLEKALSDVSYELIQARTEGNLTKDELAEILDCSEATIRNYENGLGLASNRFYTMFLLIFNKHPYFELKAKAKEKTQDADEESSNKENPSDNNESE